MGHLASAAEVVLMWPVVLEMEIAYVDAHLMQICDGCRCSSIFCRWWAAQKQSCWVHGCILVLSRTCSSTPHMQRFSLQVQRCMQEHLLLRHLYSASHMQ